MEYSWHASKRSSANINITTSWLAMNRFDIGLVIQLLLSSIFPYEGVKCLCTFFTVSLWNGMYRNTPYHSNSKIFWNKLRIFINSADNQLLIPIYRLFRMVTLTNITIIQLWNHWNKRRRGLKKGATFNLT